MDPTRIFFFFFQKCSKNFSSRKTAQAYKKENTRTTLNMVPERRIKRSSRDLGPVIAFVSLGSE